MIIALFFGADSIGFHAISTLLKYMVPNDTGCVRPAQVFESTFVLHEHLIAARRIELCRHVVAQDLDDVPDVQLGEVHAECAVLSRFLTTATARFWSDVPSFTMASSSTSHHWPS